MESGWRVLLKLTRISLIIVLDRPVCHFSGWAAGPGRKLRILSPGFTDLGPGLSAECSPVPGPGKLLLRRKIKAFD